MKKQQDNPNVLTKVHRMWYTSTFGLLIFTVLNEYSSANNETVRFSFGNTTNHYLMLLHTSWLSGFSDCKSVYNLTMASADDINDKQNDSLISVIEQYMPVWTYAFEITDARSENTFLIQSKDISNNKQTYTCTRPNGDKVTECCISMAGAEEKCQKTNQSKLEIPEINPQKLGIFASKTYINASRWASLQNEAVFIQGNEKLNVRCLLLDKNGDVWTDDCSNSHNTLCIPDDTHPVITYVNEAKLPNYSSSTTNRQPSGRSTHFTKSPSTSSNPDSNNTKSTTVSNSSNTVQGKPGFWMDLHIRYSLIAVGSFIVLAILVALCCCCCRRRKGVKSKGKTAHLAEAYSETADSIIMKETSVYETADTSEYAIPEDALKKARHRQSIGENEYDVLQKTNKTQKKFSGNAYNHVTLVSSKDKRGSSNQEENTYDVTNYGNQNAVVVSPNDLAGHVYGEVAVKTER